MSARRPSRITPRRTSGLYVHRELQDVRNESTSGSRSITKSTTWLATLSRFVGHKNNFHQITYRGHGFGFIKIYECLKDVRERVEIEMEIAPIFDMCMLDHYLPGGLVDQGQMDRKALRPLAQARRLSRRCGRQVEPQGHYKKKLCWMCEFKQDQPTLERNRAERSRRARLLARGAAKLKAFKNELDVRERKMDMYIAGEELFALRTSSTPNRTRKEVGLVDHLWIIFRCLAVREEPVDALDRRPPLTRDGGGSRPTCAARRCQASGSGGRGSAKLTDFQDSSRSSASWPNPVKPRHWKELFAQGGFTLPYDKEAFRLQDIFESPILTFREQVEEICEGADKLMGIETKLSSRERRGPRRFLRLGNGRVGIVPSSRRLGK